MTTTAAVMNYPAKSSPHRQQGITIIGLLMILALVIFFAYVGMRLFPMYQEWYSVTTAMDNMAEEPALGTQSPGQIKEALFKRLYISYSSSVKPSHVEVSKRRGTTLTVAYERREELFGNLDVIGKFEKTVPLKGR